MMFIELNDGRKENVIHISNIHQDGSDIIYESAKGSLNGYKEHFDTESKAKQRYQELQDLLLVK